MKVALVHDYIKEYGGAERVLEALHEIWPDAPVFTTVYLPEFLGPHRERFKNPPGGEASWDIRTSFLQHIPFKEKLISPFRIIAPFMFKMFTLSKYDVIIVSATGAYNPNTILSHSVILNSFQDLGSNKILKQVQNDKERDRHDKNKRTIHICYCHTPPRYLYGYATARDWKKNIILKVIGEIGNHFLRLVDFKSSQNVDYFIANSLNVKKRIQKFYRRDSVVMYPPVDLDSSKYQVVSSKYKKGIHNTKYMLRNTYFLAGGRIAKPKNIDLVVRACEELKIPLKIFGRAFGGWEKDTKILRHKDIKKKKEKSPNIQFIGEVSDEEKMELMRNAKAYIFASEDEDFGITPVEAMSVGTPVIAYRSGGVVESVIEPTTASGQNATGIFFDELTVESLKKAIKQFNNFQPKAGAPLAQTINPNDCIKQARKFSKEKFKREIKKFVYEKLGDARRS